MAAFQSRKWRKVAGGQVRRVGCEGNYSHIVLGQKFPSEKGNEMVRCCDATASSVVAKFQAGVFTHFHAVAVKHHSNMQN
jgi:hypothetical protein